MEAKTNRAQKTPVPGSERRRKRWIRWIAVIVMLALIAALVLPVVLRGGKGQTDPGRSTVGVQRGEIKSTISSSGIIEPIERYDIVPMAQGKIVSAPFEEGDIVHKDDVLYQFDAREIAISMERTRNSLDKLEVGDRATNKSIGEQVVTAQQSGEIAGLTAKVGDTIPATGAVVCQIQDRNTIRANVPFGAGQVSAVSVGQSATLISSEYMSRFDGTVTHINAASAASTDGAVTCSVEITAENPGALSAGGKVIGVIHTPQGDVESPLPGELVFDDGTQVMAETGGEVEEIFVKNGDWVQKGQTILRLANDALYDEQDRSRLDKRDLSLSLESQAKQLEDYSLKSPIDGVVITKNAKAGDNITAGVGASNVLMTVADMSKMIFYIDVDELDIARVALGQRVDVTADALPEDHFDGVITQIASEGVSQNGVTTYEVKVTIDEPGALRPGMNTNAEIVVEERQNVLTVPVEAVKKNGGRSVVYIPEDAASDEEKKAKKDAAQSEEIPDGTVEREVVTGLADDQNIEIISGLSEGDEIVVVINASSGFDPMAMGMAMGAGGAQTVPQGGRGDSGAESR